MDLNDSSADQAFRLDVRAFLAAQLPADLRERVRAGEAIEKSDRIAWYRILNARGWLAPGWPKAFGGAEWTPLQRLIFDEEASAADAPVVAAQGVAMLGPILMAFGTDEQKRHYLPRILNSDDWWCQGYSEPESGSDLASLQTRAERDGDVYIVNGQKTWITQADIADMMFALVRTSTGERKHDGISFLLIDMRAPGITVRPIPTLNGGAEICEVFLDNVRVPVANRIGDEGKGWSYAMYLLEHERGAVGNVARAKAQLDRVRRRAADQSQYGGFAADLARLEIRLLAARLTQLRAVTATTADGRAGNVSSLLKIVGTELMQEIGYLGMSVDGPAAIERTTPATSAYLDGRKLSIFSGSNEIQRNIVAKRLLGL
jgi:alkylation response protein AidB-like acyl-CoA dehydrogenase